MPGASRIALLPGDGTGPEVLAQGERVLAAAAERFGLAIETQRYLCGAQYYAKTGREWEEGALAACKASDAILLGAVGWPGVSLPDGNIAGAGVVFGLRFGLDLYANVRPCKLYPGVRHNISGTLAQVWKPENVDCVIVRENTEGLYTPARGWLERGGQVEVAVDNNVITRKGSQRVIEFAFQLSERRAGAPKDHKKRVTCIDKSNVLRGSQLFRLVYDEVAARHPGIEKDYAYVDAFCQWMLRQPESYDVAVATNMMGDIVTDLAAVLQGGMGMAAGGNIGDKHAMFEPIHGSSPKHAGKDAVNPMATVAAVQMMLEWLGHRRGDGKFLDAARAIDAAVEAVCRDGKTLTYDLGGTAKCSEVGAAIAERVRQATSYGQ
ncbi:MAG TPA: isocitrate/isopropylmalate dehydrogenase family protein [Candidatus Thermoplasmatota archaeon]|jgi:3-isopropylmalate dehydrogenase|nr:isocitrate/isopropylmalate dehydrogenase family protein [Candidatus Thermoplasmatota archaeon]